MTTAAASFVLFSALPFGSGHPDLLPPHALRLAFTAPGDPVLAAAYWAGIGALLVTLLLGSQILRLRFALRKRQRLETQAFARWRPVLSAAVIGEAPAQLPRLTAGERLPFVKLWVHLHASLRGAAGAALNDIARRLGLETDARAMLARGTRTERLLAALMLGHLRDRSAWPLLVPLAESPDSTLALTVLWALVRIDPEAAARYLTPLFIERDDWAMSHVAGVLGEASEPVAEVLAALLPNLDSRRLPRALRIAEALRLNLPAEPLNKLIADARARDDVALLTASLRIVNTPGSIEPVRAALAHPDWQVRVLAAKALGRIGDRSDADRLVALLADPEWWVRYRAAQALVELPWLTRADLDTLRTGLTDRFAADILAQVVAETRPSKSRAAATAILAGVQPGGAA